MQLISATLNGQAISECYERSRVTQKLGAPRRYFYCWISGSIDPANAAISSLSVFQYGGLKRTDHVGVFTRNDPSSGFFFDKPFWVI